MMWVVGGGPVVSENHAKGVVHEFFHHARHMMCHTNSPRITTGI